MRNRDSLEASQKVLEMGRRIESIRNDIYKLEGIQRSPKDQEKHLQVLQKQLEMKKKLIAKYKGLNLKVSGLSGAL